MLGGICQGGRTWLTIGVGTLQERPLFTNYCSFYINIITPNATYTFHRVIKIESYGMNTLLNRKLKIEPHNPTKTWG